jgi:hypothetical protein
MNEFMRNWLTTLVGLIAAVANALVPLVQQGDVSAQTLLQSAGLAALGFVSKSFNVSGTKSE